METYNNKLTNLLQSYNISPPLRGSSKVNVGTNERLISAAGGALLTYLGSKNKGTLKKLMNVSGSYLLMRSATGYCAINNMMGRDTAMKDGRPIDITARYKINRPRSEVYAYWRNLENLPKFMNHLEEVRPIDATHSYWIAPVPGGMGTVEWEAEITQEDKNERLAWQSLPEADVDNAGEVLFTDDPEDEGTIVQAFITYRAPEGDLGSSVAQLLNPKLKQMVKKDLKRFKSHMEGEVSTL